MNTRNSFLNWLWSDWGKPNLLTRAGIPRIVTNSLTYILFPYICYRLSVRNLSSSDKLAVRLALHNAFFVVAYCTFYVSLVTEWFLRHHYNSGKLRIEERLTFVRKNWGDPIVKINCISFWTSFLLFIVGAFYFRQKLPG